ncbi:hypothetical protein HYQ46_005615 [Verticillium longisporum]|nr:hypothetical protein HYQ46_005615 [Verticillium longisporum]
MLSPLGPQLLGLGALLVVGVHHLLVQLALLLGQHALGPLVLLLLLGRPLGQRLARRVLLRLGRRRRLGLDAGAPAKRVVAHGGVRVVLRPGNVHVGRLEGHGVELLVVHLLVAVGEDLALGLLLLERHRRVVLALHGAHKGAQMGRQLRAGRVQIRPLELGVVGAVPHPLRLDVHPAGDALVGAQLLRRLVVLGLRLDGFAGDDGAVHNLPNARRMNSRGPRGVSLDR